MAVWKLGLEKSVFSFAKHLGYSQPFYLSRCMYSKESNSSIFSSWLKKSPNKRSPDKPGVTTEPPQSQSLAVVKDSPKRNEIVEIQKRIPFREHSVPSMEKFIPLTRQELVKGLAKETALFSPSEIKQLDQLALSFDAYFSRRFYIHQEEMKVCS